MAKKKIKEGYDRIELEKEEKIPTLSEQVSQYDRRKAFKKISKVLTGFLLIFMFIFLCWTAFGMTSFCFIDTVRQNSATTEFDKIDDLFYSDGVASDEDIQKMQKFISELPQAVQDALHQDWIIIISDDVPSVLFSKTFAPKNQFDTSDLVLAGFTFTQSHVVYINASIPSEEIYHAFIHEIGHVVSFEHGSIHGSLEWKDIFDENSRRLDITDYGKSNEAEFFATMFDMYYTDTETIQHAAPHVYDYIETVLDTEIRDDNMWQTYTQSYVNAANVILSYAYETFRVY